MALNREEATRIARFCLAGVGWGTALREDDACVIQILRSEGGASAVEARRFAGETFDSALRKAAAGGAIDSARLEKQIAFLARTLPGRDRETPAAGGPWRGTSGGAASPGETFSLLTQTVSAFLTQAQSERGISALYLASRGRRFGARLETQWRSTDAQRARLAVIHDVYRHRLAPEAEQRLQRAEAMAAKVVEGRRLIEDLATSAPEAIVAYSQMNAGFLAVIDALAARGTDVAFRPTALAWMALLHAKEKTGMERAQLASAFATDRFALGQHAAVSGLIASSESFLHVFAAAAPPPAEELLRRSLTSEVASAVAEMEGIALAHERGGFGVDPEIWFTSVTRKMELFAEVERAVHASVG